MAIIDLKLCHSTDFHGYFDPQISFKCLTIIWGEGGSRPNDHKGDGEVWKGPKYDPVLLEWPLNGHDFLVEFPFLVYKLQV